MKTYKEALEYVRWQIIFALEEECTEEARERFISIMGQVTKKDNIQDIVMSLEENQIKNTYNLVYRTTKK